MAADPRRYTQTELDELVSCVKVVRDAPRKQEKLDRGHFRKDLRLTSEDGSLEFRVFMRRSEDLPENFSIGLVFRPKDGTSEVTRFAAMDRTEHSALPSTPSILTATIMCIEHLPR